MSNKNISIVTIVINEAGEIELILGDSKETIHEIPSSSTCHMGEMVWASRADEDGGLTLSTEAGALLSWTSDSGEESQGTFVGFKRVDGRFKLREKSP